MGWSVVGQADLELNVRQYVAQVRLAQQVGRVGGSFRSLLRKELALAAVSSH